MHFSSQVLTRKSLMPWRTPWSETEEAFKDTHAVTGKMPCNAVPKRLDESNLHHDTFLEQRAAHSSWSKFFSSSIPQSYLFQPGAACLQGHRKLICFQGRQLPP